MFNFVLFEGQKYWMYLEALLQSLYKSDIFSFFGRFFIDDQKEEGVKESHQIRIQFQVDVFILTNLFFI